MKMFKLVEESCLGSLSVIETDINKLLNKKDAQFKITTTTDIKIENNIIKMQSYTELIPY
ncbi:hypothetical protein AAEX28_02260 [Lentisphaerota bacterium WC36G]|nr:hypothetical protein LJT99_05145 [Lentisphaerae bacterium WC36]